MTITRRIIRENYKRIARLNQISGEYETVRRYLDLPTKVFLKVTNDRAIAIRDNFETYDQLCNKYLPF